MERASDNRFVITSLASLKASTEKQSLADPAAFHKRLAIRLARGVYSDCLYIELADELLALAEHAYGFRDGDRIVEISQTLLSMPLPDQYKSAARFFCALGLRRRGELEKGDLLLEQVAAEPTHSYTARALQSLGAVMEDRADFESALRLYRESGRRAAENAPIDYTALLFSQNNIGKIKGLIGDHRGAVSGLERLTPFVRTVGARHPHLIYQHCNSLAVELAYVGRLEEAARASRIAVRSPFSRAYPEFHETFSEIELKRRRAARSAVVVRSQVAEPASDARNLLHLPLVQRDDNSAPLERLQQGAGARVLNFQRWKAAVKASSRAIPLETPAEQRRWMTTGEKLIRLMDLISRDETDDETIDRILEAVQQIVLNRKNDKLH